MNIREIYEQARGEWKFVILSFILIIIANDVRQLVAEFQVRNISHFRNHYCADRQNRDWIALQESLWKYELYSFSEHPYDGMNENQLCDEPE